MGSLALAFLVGLAISCLKLNPGHLFFGRDKHEIRFAVQNQPRQMMVFIKGAVQNPGVYEVPAGTRFQEAIARSQPSTEADLMSLPLADFVRDGQTIIVPVKAEERSMCVQNLSARGGPGKVNLNRADQSDLESLPGIGPSLAARILDYRQKHPFSSIEELMEIPGVGTKKFEELKDRIIIE